MRNKEYFDESQIRKTIEVLKPNGELFEIRIIGKSGNRKRIISGYFTDAETLISAFDTIDPRGTNIYITLNRVKRDCYAREQHDCFRQTDSTTHDHEVEAYEWLFIDMDPIRIADVSSTDEELGLAKQMARDVAFYMDSIGFSQPVEALSGNGAHLLYRIDCPADDVHKALIGKCLKALADKFNTDRVKIDEVNLNQSRICKLYGTWAQKGANTQERPYRLSEIVSAPNEIEINSTDLLEVLADDFTEVTQPCQEHGAFDLEQFMSEHGLTYSDKKNDLRSVIYPLDNCPFDNSHTNGDAKIFSYPDGAIAFKCHHNSCKQYKWQDVRLMFEPDAYTKDEETEKRIEEGWQKHKAMQPVVIVKKSEDIEEIKQNIPKLLPISALDLQQKKFDKTYYAVEGLIPEGETVIAAPPKTGKSWLMLDMCLKISEGEKFLDFQTTKSDTLYLALEDGESFEQERLNIVLKGKPAPNNFHIVFNNVMRMQNGFLFQLEDLLKAYPDIKVVVIDTLNFIKYRKGRDEQMYESDYRTGSDLKQFAEEHHIAIVVVTHTTKMKYIDDDMSNVSGSNGVTGASDSVIVISKEKRTSMEAKLFVTGRKVRQTTHQIKFDDKTCCWKYIGLITEDDAKLIEKQRRDSEYFNSSIRGALVTIAANITEDFTFRSSELVSEAVEYGIAITESNKEIGLFLNTMQGMLLEHDNIRLQIIKNGTGAKSYKISPTTDELPF